MFFCKEYNSGNRVIILIYILKKKILFIISSLESGGVSKSITSLLNIIDRKRYDISLMVLSFTGPFVSLIPKDIRIITNPIWEALTNRLSGLKYLIKHNPMLIPGHLLRLALSKFDKSYAGILLAKLMPGIDEDFDAIIDFNGQHQLYYMVNKLRATKKITFFHSDYSKWPYYYKADKKYFPKVDNIFTISNHCVSVMKEWFPENSNKIDLMENISSLKIIEKMALEPITDMKEDCFTILTVGHVSENKGTSLALKAAKILREKGIDFHWYFIGSNENKTFYTNMVNDLSLSNYISFLGIKTNPYPYMQKASIIVHPSKFEGKSIALDEVKLLCKPVVVTNFSTVQDQFTNGYNANICEMNAEAIANNIIYLLHDSEKRNFYESNLEKDRKDNSNEINKLYSAFK